MSTIEHSAETSEVYIPQDLEDVLRPIAAGADPRCVERYLPGVSREEAVARMAGLREFFDAKTLAQAVHRAIDQNVLHVRKKSPETQFSDTQISVMGWMAVGLENREIGEKFGRSKQAFSHNHIKPLFKKMNVSTREAIVVRGHQFSLITPDLISSLERQQ